MKKAFKIICGAIACLCIVVGLFLLGAVIVFVAAGILIIALPVWIFRYYFSPYYRETKVSYFSQHGMVAEIYNHMRKNKIHFEYFRDEESEFDYFVKNGEVLIPHFDGYPHSRDEESGELLVAFDESNDTELRDAPKEKLYTAEDESDGEIETSGEIEIAEEFEAPEEIEAPEEFEATEDLDEVERFTRIVPVSEELAKCMPYIRECHRSLPVRFIIFLDKYEENIEPLVRDDSCFYVAEMLKKLK